MAYNLFIAYDLHTPGQNYEAVKQRIASLGPHHQFQLSLFYVNTDLDPHAAYQAVMSVMDINDRLMVINAQSGVTSDWDGPLITSINEIWRRP